MPLHVNGDVIPLKLDTGAQVNLINELDIKAMTVKPRIHLYYSKPLRAYNGQPIISKGSCRLKVKVKGKQYNVMFAVVTERHVSVLGDKACEWLGLVKRVCCTDAQDSVKTVVDQYLDVFDRFGVLPFTYKIQLKDDAQPVVHV